MQLQPIQKSRTKSCATTNTKRNVILLSLAILMILGWQTLVLYFPTHTVNSSSMLLNVFRYRNVSKDTDTQQKEPDINYSIRQMIKPNLIPEIRLITDSISNTSFIFYPSDILEWVMSNDGEKFVRSVISKVLTDNVNKTQSSVMLDIGANMGYYGILSLSMGIGQAIFFDPQPMCTQIIESLITLNAFNERARIVNHPIGDGKLLRVPVIGCGGRFPVNRHESGNKDAYGQNDNHYHESIGNTAFVSFFTVDQALKDIGNRTILMVKIDTEGFELSILPLLFTKLEKHQIINVVVEITPFWWQYTNHTTTQGDMILGQIIEFGYHATNKNGTKISTKQQMTQFINNHNPKQQHDMWFHCISC